MYIFLMIIIIGLISICFYEWLKREVKEWIKEYRQKIEDKTKCPNCKRDITTMKNITKPSKYLYICKCGKDITKIKLLQLAKKIAEVIND